MPIETTKKWRTGRQWIRLTNLIAVSFLKATKDVKQAFLSGILRIAFTDYSRGDDLFRKIKATQHCICNGVGVVLTHACLVL